VEFFRGLPFPLAVAALFVIVLLRAGGTYALGRAARSGAGRNARVQRMVDSPRFLRAQQLVARWGAPIVVVSFLTVGFQTLANLAAGVGRMPLRRYLPALALGGLLWAVLYATVGLITWAALSHLYAISPVAATIGVLVLLAALVGYVVWQVRRGDRSSAPPATPDVAPAPRDGAEGG
jgi:membrane protein DedA with SNARE-associated domain